MRLFHVSEECDIHIFEPRLPTRKDLDPAIGLVWAIDETRLSNFLTPRNCPRIGYHVGPNTNAEDRARFFLSPDVTHALVIEHKWYNLMQSTKLYLYEFDPADFVLQDAVAGYYVAKKTQSPKQKHIVTDLFAELIARNVEIHITDNLWNFADKVKISTLDWSLCRMAFAQSRKEA